MIFFHFSENRRYELKSRMNSMTHEMYDSISNLNLNREASQFRNRQLLQVTEIKNLSKKM